MDLSIFGIIVAILSDPVPAHRVARKTSFISVVLSLILIVYRHSNLGFSSVESIFVTIGLIIILFFYLLLGGVIAGAFYEWVMKKYEKSMEPTLSILLLEWVIAVVSPFTLILLPQPYGI